MRTMRSGSDSGIADLWPSCGKELLELSCPAGTTPNCFETTVLG
jgi:hypothetical protein